MKCGVNVANGTRKGWLGHGVSWLVKVCVLWVLFSSCKKQPSLKGLVFHVCKFPWGTITIVNFIFKVLSFFTFIFPLSKQIISAALMYIFDLYFPILQLWVKPANICDCETSRNGLWFLFLPWLTPIQAGVTDINKNYCCCCLLRIYFPSHFYEMKKDLSFHSKDFHEQTITVQDTKIRN